MWLAAVGIAQSACVFVCIVAAAVCVTSVCASPVCGSFVMRWHCGGGSQRGGSGLLLLLGGGGRAHVGFVAAPFGGGVHVVAVCVYRK